MERRKIVRCVIALMLLALLPMLVTVTTVSETEVSATPHTISTTKHPYDPDWPDVYMILATKCSKCHRPGSDDGNLMTYNAIIDGKSTDDERLVIPGNPDDSVLWQKVVWNVEALSDSDLPDEPEMPDDHRHWLTKGQLATLKRWIKNGALEYKLPDTCSPRPLMEMDFPSAKECQVCHPKQYDEWSRSMHHYAQHSPIFEAFNLTLVERTGGTIGTFCSRCHTPIGTALGENASRRNIHRSRISMEGVTCIVCHRQSKPNYKSNARQYIEPGKMLDGCLYGPFDDSVSEEHQAHDSKHQPYLKSSAFCGTCHDVTNPQGIRLEEAYSEWQNSPAAKQGTTCQHCHMGPVPGMPIADHGRPVGRAAEVPGVDPKLIPLRHLSNHTFTGPDYSILPDTEFPEKLDWQYETDYRKTEKLTPHQQKTLKELRYANRKQLETANKMRYQLLKNAAKITVHAPPLARPGKSIKVKVDVTNKVSGHSFPTGFTAERQLWVYITLYDPSGKIVFQSGHLDKNMDLCDEHSHEVEAGKRPYDKHLLNFQNKFTALTQKGTDRSVVLSVNRHLSPLNMLRPATGVSPSFGRPPGFRIAKASIPPLATIGQKYPIDLPKIEGNYLLDVRLNFRHIPPALLDKIGIAHLKHLLEIVEIDHYQTVIPVSNKRP